MLTGASNELHINFQTASNEPVRNSKHLKYHYYILFGLLIFTCWGHTIGYSANWFNYLHAYQFCEHFKIPIFFCQQHCNITFSTYFHIDCYILHT